MPFLLVRRRGEACHLRTHARHGRKARAAWLRWAGARAACTKEDVLGLPVRGRAHLVLQQRPVGLKGRIEVIGAARLRLRLDELVTRAPRGSDALVRPSDVARACGFDTEAAQKLTRRHGAPAGRLRRLGELARLKVGHAAGRKCWYRRGGRGQRREGHPGAQDLSCHYRRRNHRDFVG